jgi:hypothetical protein
MSNYALDFVLQFGVLFNLLSRRNCKLDQHDFPDPLRMVSEKPVKGEQFLWNALNVVQVLLFSTRAKNIAPSSDHLSTSSHDPSSFQVIQCKQQATNGKSHFTTGGAFFRGSKQPPED